VASTKARLSGARSKREVSKEVPLQVMLPSPIRKQVGMLSAERGESLRITVLRGLKAIGVKVPETEFSDRRGRRTKD
jgi:hypothetical protein